ncbi:MAG TPA: CRISPR-associated protein Csx19 [Bryobacteraceae bacterium]|nr:CRISPR-associated protein Csx19 [Bryobacteraceae bacterium]
MSRIEMSPSWLKNAALAVGGNARALIQGYPYTGFARVSDTGELTAPDVELSAPVWRRFWDVRVFGQDGEWHAWRGGDSIWQDRDSRVHAREGRECIQRTYALWGSDAEIHDGWTCCQEQRGARIWVPFDAWHIRRLPLEVEVQHVVDFDENGICGVVDFFITGFKGEL